MTFIYQILLAQISVDECWQLFWWTALIAVKLVVIVIDGHDFFFLANYAGLEANAACIVIGIHVPCCLVLERLITCYRNVSLRSKTKLNNIFFLWLFLLVLPLFVDHHVDGDRLLLNRGDELIVAETSLFLHMRSFCLLFAYQTFLFSLIKLNQPIEQLFIDCLWVSFLPSHLRLFLALVFDLLCFLVLVAIASLALPTLERLRAVFFELL